MPTHLKLKVEELENSIDKLSQGRRDFARSLCEQFWKHKRPLSAKQEMWVDKLLEMAKQPAPEQRPVQELGDMQGVLDLFSKAKQHLKYPAIVLAIPVADPEAFRVKYLWIELHYKRDKDGNILATYFFARINVAGERAKVPGSINVTSYDVDHHLGRRRWFGRVMPDGSYSPTDDVPPGVVDALLALAADPARVAAEHGKLTGHCCFCHIALSDERSTAVGYGKICAGHYHLPWGARPAEFAGSAA